jgi:2-C-methyl-D-erythritol 4-phosphate cytidylyltransferase
LPRHFALVPAAGSGSRVGTGMRKQYLAVNGLPLLQYSLRRLASHALISQVFVVLAPDDAEFEAFRCAMVSPKVRPLYCGAEHRAASVYNGLLAVRDALEADDWVLVHDAARPCLSRNALERLIREVGSDEVGGLLAIPVADTLKRVDGDDRVAATERREGLWQAQTPQMFRYGTLVDALRACGPGTVTDEAGAIERFGLRPKLVMGEARNIKVTFPEDVELAGSVLGTATSESEEVNVAT